MSGLGFIGGDEVGALVLDVGAMNFRVGYAGEEQPRAIGCSLAGAAAEPGRRDSSPQPAEELFFPVDFYRKNTEISELRPCMRFVDKKVDMDKDVFELLVGHAFGKRRPLLPGLDLSQHPLILSEPNRSPAVRKAMLEISFEKLHVPASFTLRRSVASAFSVGKGSGLVVDLGASHLSVCPVFEGFSLLKSAREFPVGGDVLDTAVEQLLGKKGIACTAFWERDGLSGVKRGFMASSRLATARRIKEEMCRTTVDTVVPATALANWSLPPSSPEHFELPDRTIIDVSSFSTLIPELLFEPYPLTASPLPGMSGDIGGFQGNPSAISDALGSVDVDARKQVGQEIILVGGGSLFNKLPERLTKHMGKTKITAVPSERANSSWLGCSIAASLATFQHLWISKQQYAEHGPDRLLDHRIIF